MAEAASRLGGMNGVVSRATAGVGVSVSDPLSDVATFIIIWLIFPCDIFRLTARRSVAALDSAKISGKQVECLKCE